MKICYLVPSLRSSGPTNQLLYLVEENSISCDCTVIYLSKKNISVLHIKELQKLNINIKQVSFIKSFKFIRSENFDLIHSQGLLADIISTFQIFSKSVITVRNNPFHDYPSKFGLFKGYIMAILHWIIQFLNSNVVSCSYALGKDLNKNGISNITIQNGTRVPKDNLSVLRSNKNNLQGLSTGNLIPRKNYEYTFDLFSQLENIKLDIYGKGDSSFYKYPSNISFKGYNQEVNELYKNYNFFISTSISEGLPNSVLEAAMNGLPLILSNISPHKEISEVIPHCLLIDINKSESENVKLIIQYLKNIDIKMREEISYKARAYFSKERMAKKYFELYKSKT